MKGLIATIVAAAMLSVPSLTSTDVQRQPLTVTPLETQTVEAVYIEPVNYNSELRWASVFPEPVPEPEVCFPFDPEPEAEVAASASGGWTYYGTCTITFYCPGPCCCGQYASGYTASGTRATANRTVAMSGLPFGTEVMIDGQVYVVEDRGVGGMWVDIFVDTHEEALRRGMYEREVYIR